MNLYPHFRLLRHDLPRRMWTLELSIEDEQRRWDVPRGPPLHPHERHLAVQREPSTDLPSIGDCWDAGPCEVRKWTPRHVVAVLHGAKIKGCFALVQFRRAGSPHWLWVRVRPAHHTQPPARHTEVARELLGVA